MEEIKLDLKDRKILAELDFNARQQISKIARKVRLSKEVVLYRIKRLESLGVIRDYHVVVNNSKLGNYYSRLLVKFQNLDRLIEEKIINYCKKNSRIGYYGRLDGSWDILIGYWSKDLFEFEEFVEEFTYNFGKYILDREISFGLHVWQLPYKFLFIEIPFGLAKGFGSSVGLGSCPRVNTRLFKNHYSREFETGGKVVQMDLDEVDKELLIFLTKDARMNLQELGKNLRLSWKTIDYRIKNLERDKIIIGYRTNIDYKKFGYSNTKVFLYLQNLTKEKERELIYYLKSMENCIWVIKYLGKSDLEFEVLVKNREEFFSIIQELREKFSNIIRNYDSFTIHEEPISRFVPID